MRALKWLVAAVMCACSPYAARDGAGGSPPELGSSLNVRVVEDSVRLEIHVTNVTSSPIALEFATTQRYDFEIASAGGERIWQWSDGMMFGQALGRDVLESGESRRYTASWWGGGRAGDFIARARIVSRTYPVELSTGFRLPGE